MTRKAHHRLVRTLGLGGVDPQENSAARKLGAWLEWPMILAALWILVDWYLASQRGSSGTYSRYTDPLVWSFFLVELVSLTLLVDDRRRHLRRNWLNVLIVLGGIPVLMGVDVFYAGLLRSLRLLLMLGIFVRVSDDVYAILNRHNLGTTLAIGFVLLLIAGVLISGIDPAFKSPLDGIWWAWVTVTTVGYGDLVPTTTEGRIFGALLILMGIGLFSMLTASFSAFFIEQDEKALSRREAENIKRISGLENRLEHIEKQLEHAVAALERIENRSPSDDNRNGDK
ncbi:potassium channel protein [Marinobacterium nitratireducens]|uniref:Potassium channel protein n=1 Tax=Marinobacterium nitratireducens TaxID=518897 RepID=A0A918DRD8_9GAMM|nr:potassium channel family protein [Marinobacterium nitratireducens]GGO81027.1 potassium channel protein [Marinobacterium nitratireducens]